MNKDIHKSYVDSTFISDEESGNTIVIVLNVKFISLYACL
jgi:hypothetical protein